MMRTRTILVACATMVTMGLHAQSFETAAEAVKNMGVGWNLGNTLDANGNGVHQGLDSETYWGQPVTKPELMKMMKEAGFGAIRVPVTWYNHMNANGTVDAEWMARVKQVVDYVLDNGMYCILNVHHDTGDDSKNSSIIHWIHASMNTYNNTKTKYENLWKQIAETFKDYDQHLLFEGYNEMLDDLNSWCFASYNAQGKYNATSATDSYNAINNYAKSFVTTVRATGGNNQKRNLVINTYAASNGSGSWNQHLQEPLSELKLPTDPGGTGHLAVQVHAYPNLSTGKADIADMFKKLKTYFIDKGTPVILGEWATSNVDAAVTDYDAKRSEYLNFAVYVVKEAMKYNAATFYWMGISDGAMRNLPAFSQPDLAKNLTVAYHGGDWNGKYPTQDDFEISYVVNYTSKWAELFLYGDWGSSKSLKLSEYSGIRVEMDNDSYAGKLQVKVYGDKDGKNSDGSDKFKEQYTALTAATTTVNFDASQLGSTVNRVTLQTLVGPTTAKVNKATLIKKDGTEEPGTITSAWGCTVTAESSPITGVQTLRYSPEQSDKIYNLSGQLVTNPRKGVYVVNGKKVVMK